MLAGGKRLSPTEPTGETGGPLAVDEVEMNTTNNSKLTGNAKALRKNMTKEERHLWYDFLKDYPARFLRQKVIDNYIVDFYCNKAKLVIEIDGFRHFTEDGLINDRIRTSDIGEYGLYVMRFTNYEVKSNFRGVCKRIDDYVRKALQNAEGNPSTTFGGPLPLAREALKG